MKHLLFLLSMFLIEFVVAQNPIIEWEKSYGGSSMDIASDITPTSDGGYISIGTTFSSDGDVTGYSWLADIWVVKMDVNGTIEWENAYGGSGDDTGNSISQTSDGGYIFSGKSASTNGDLTNNYGLGDYWLVKIDALGTIEWQISLGGSQDDRASKVMQTSDGGYFFVGGSESNDFDVSGNNGSRDVWVVKLSSTGVIQWQDSFGGSNTDRAHSAEQTSDGGYIIGGWSSSPISGDITASYGSTDYWVIKLSSAGVLEWQKSYGGSNWDVAYSIIQTTDGGYAMVGESASVDGDISNPNGSVGTRDVWVVKTDPAGNIEWEKSLGGTVDDHGYSIIQMNDDGYIIGGYTFSNDGYVSNNNGAYDNWFIKLNALGQLEWEKSFGGSSDERWGAIKPTSDGGFIASGSSMSSDGDATFNNGAEDFWILKIDVKNINGNVYYDLDESCTQEINELGAPNINLLINPGNYVVTTNNFGGWYIDSLPAGSYSITIDTTTSWNISCQNTQNFTVIDPNGFTNVSSFGVYSDIPCPEPNVSIYAPFLRFCFPNQKIYVSACNEITGSDVIYGAYVDVVIDPLATPTSSSLPYSVIGTDTLRFVVGDLYPGQCVDFDISTQIACTPDVPGRTICMEALLFPVNNCALDTIPTPPLPPTTGNDPNMTLPLPCTLPWDNSSLMVEGWCQNDSVYFSITNTGDFVGGDMDCYSPVFLYVNDTLISIDSVLLQGQQTVYYSFPANGETWILAAEQHPLHPGNSHPNAHVEACGTSINNWIPDMINNQPLDDADPVNDIYCGVVTVSYDPNDKTGYPNGVSSNNYILPNQQLQYVIRFQNTGTDTAFIVVIRDTLDVNLNLFTVTSGVASHPYSFQMISPRVLEWTFDNILLPDSTTNEPESNGFVTFTVDQVPNLVNGTVITNDADIYFDFNAPITTNETVHVINDMIYSSPLYVQELSYGEVEVVVYPNPSNSIINIAITDTNHKLHYQLINLEGKILRSGEINEASAKIDISNLSIGSYMLIFDNGLTARIVKI